MKKIIQLVLTYNIIVLDNIARSQSIEPDNTEVKVLQDIKVSPVDKGSFCNFKFENDELYKFCAYYGRLPY